MMAISESVRLVKELYKERIPVRHLFVNQVQVENNHCSFCCARYKEHKANLQYIREQFQGLRITPVQVNRCIYTYIFRFGLTHICSVLIERFEVYML